MKTEFKVKFLQHINKKNQDKGFTLIELLVVVIIIGILAAIALPSLLSQTNKAKQAEARQNCGAMNRSQQAYYLERQTFASTILELGVGIKEQTENFSYTIVSPGTDGVQNQCTPVKPNLKTYTGRTYTTIQTNGESLTQALLCESDSPTQTALAVAASTCPTGSKDLGK